MEQHEKNNKNQNHHEKHELSEHHNASKPFSKSFYKKVYILLGAVLVLFSIYNLFQISLFDDVFNIKLAEAKEAARPAEIELLVITANVCKDCYDINAVIDVIESTGVNITKKKEIDFSSKEAKSFINKYKIEKVPTVILTGELNKSRSLSLKLKNIGEEKQDAFIFTKLEPPFIETSSGKIRGEISLIYLKKDDCNNCSDLTLFINQLEESGLKFKKQVEVDVTSNEGKNLINKYKIKKVPTIIMDEEAEVYPNIVQSWNQLGSIENDGSFILRQIQPPYYSVEEAKVKGLVAMTVLLDNTCEDCYEPDKFHKPILQRMGVVFSEENRLDISDAEGKSLIKEYKIEKVPTIILKGDVEEYPVLVNAWKDVGTVESDGTYVFRNVEVAQQKYKDITTGEIISPQTTS